MTCQYLKDGRCTLAQSHAFGVLELPLECRPEESLCEECLATGEPNERRPSIPCLGLVTKQVTGEHRVKWRAYINQLLFGQPVPVVVVPAPKPAKWTGLGDVVASATKAVGIKPCGGCKKRQAWLNKVVPFE